MAEPCGVKTGRRKERRSLYAAVGAILFLLAPSSSCLGAEEGPLSFVVEQDWKMIMNSSINCSSCVRLSSVRVLGMDTRKNSASVRIEVVGDWVGLRDCQSATGPCSGFNPKGGIHQVVNKTLRYRKYDSGWKLDYTERKSRRGNHRKDPQYY